MYAAPPSCTTPQPLQSFLKEKGATAEVAVTVGGRLRAWPPTGYPYVLDGSHRRPATAIFRRSWQYETPNAATGLLRACSGVFGLCEAFPSYCQPMMISRYASGI